jgi:hypothetical protein
MAVSIARTWEILIMLSDRGAPLEDYPLGVAFRLPRSPVVEIEAPYSLLAGSSQDEPMAEAEADEGEPADVDG